MSQRGKRRSKSAPPRKAATKMLARILRNTAPKKMQNRRSQSRKRQINTRGVKFNTMSTQYRKAPVARGAIFRNNQVEKCFIVENQEYLSPVATQDNSGAFSVLSFPLNPGLSNTFPWLAGIAQNFQLYSVDFMNFEFKSTVPTSSGGAIYMAAQMNPDGLAPTSVGNMVDIAQSVRGSVWTSFECRPDFKKRGRTKKKFYMRNGALADLDYEDYDIGDFYIASNGYAVQGVIGDLLVKYRVRFYEPIVPALLGMQYGQIINYGNTALKANATDTPWNTPVVYADFTPPGTTTINTSSLYWERSGMYFVYVRGGLNYTGTPPTSFTGSNIIPALTIGTTALYGNLSETQTNTNLTGGSMSWWAVLQVAAGSGIVLNFHSGGGAGTNAALVTAGGSYLPEVMWFAIPPSMFIENSLGAINSLNVKNNRKKNVRLIQNVIAPDDLEEKDFINVVNPRVADIEVVGDRKLGEPRRLVVEKILDLPRTIDAVLVPSARSRSKSPGKVALDDKPKGLLSRVDEGGPS